MSQTIFCQNSTETQVGFNWKCPTFVIFEAPFFHKGASMVSNCLGDCMYVTLLKEDVLRSNCLYLTEFEMDFGQVLDSKSYDQT